MIQDQIAALIHGAILAAQESGTLPLFEAPSVETTPVERPKQEGYGDFASPVAMQLARVAHRSPRQIADAIAAHIPVGEPSGGVLAGVEVANPGFINLRLSESWLTAQVDRVLSEGPHFADLTIGQGKKAQVEFISANPTGPLTVGHGRGAVIGDVLASILEAGGYEVTREYYFNDGGLQMKNLAQSVRRRAHQLLGGHDVFPDDLYQGEYIVDIARDLLAEHGDDVVDWDWTHLRDAAVAVIFADIRVTLDRLGIVFDVYFNEMTLYDRARSGNVWEIVDRLRTAGLAYDAEGAVWFKATEFGSDKDRVIIRSSGEPTYRLPDIAYHVDKIARGFDVVVDVLGADHVAQHPDIMAAVGALNGLSESIHVVSHQFVTLVRDGAAVKMSTRKATYVTLDELIDEVGVDAMRFFMVNRSADSQFEFDLDLAKSQSDDNPAYYIQYAHARTAGILDRTAPRYGIAYNPAADVTLLTHPAEIALIGYILRLEEVLAHAVTRLEPHHLAYYAAELATRFATFYRDCRVLKPEDVGLSQARLKLVRATRIALARSLDLLGMSAPDEMSRPPTETDIVAGENDAP